MLWGLLLSWHSRCFGHIFQRFIITLSILIFYPDYKIKTMSHEMKHGWNEGPKNPEGLKKCKTFSCIFGWNMRICVTVEIMMLIVPISVSVFVMIIFGKAFWCLVVSWVITSFFIWISVLTYFEIIPKITVYVNLNSKITSKMLWPQKSCPTLTPSPRRFLRCISISQQWKSRATHSWDADWPHGQEFWESVSKWALMCFHLVCFDWSKLRSLGADRLERAKRERRKRKKVQKRRRNNSFNKLFARVYSFYLGTETRS